MRNKYCIIKENDTYAEVILMKNINEFLYGSVLKVTRNDTIETIEKNFKDMKVAGQDTVVIWPGFFWW